MEKLDFIKICEQFDLKGASVTFLKNGKLTSYQMGYMSEEEQLETHPNTIYRIASISKTILAVGAMKLYEDGLLDLDKDISDYLGFTIRNPKFPNHIITTRQIMTQTSSITDGFDDEEMENDSRVDGYNGVNGRILGIPLETMLVPNDSPHYSDLTYSDFEPGSHFIYSNFGCGILACIIEKISGKNYDDFMQETLFSKLNIDASYFPYKLKHPEHIATLYRGEHIRTGKSFVERAYKKMPLGESYIGPAGGCFISINDLAKVMLSFIDKDYMVLKEETINYMLQENWRGTEYDDGYIAKALQMVIYEDALVVPLYGHFGTAYGLRSMMLFNKDLKMGVCFATNGGNIYERSHHIPKIHYTVLTNIFKEQIK